MGLSRYDEAIKAFETALANDSGAEPKATEELQQKLQQAHKGAEGIFALEQLESAESDNAAAGKVVSSGGAAALQPRSPVDPSTQSSQEQTPGSPGRSQQ